MFLPGKELAMVNSSGVIERYGVASVDTSQNIIKLRTPILSQYELKTPVWSGEFSLTGYGVYV